MWKVWRLETKINSGLKQTNVPQGGRVTAEKTGKTGLFVRYNEAMAITEKNVKDNISGGGTVERLLGWLFAILFAVMTFYVFNELGKLELNISPYHIAIAVMANVVVSVVDYFIVKHLIRKHAENISRDQLLKEYSGTDEITEMYNKAVAQKAVFRSDIAGEGSIENPKRLCAPSPINDVVVTDDYIFTEGAYSSVRLLSRLRGYNCVTRIVSNRGFFKPIKRYYLTVKTDNSIYSYMFNDEMDMILCEKALSSLCKEIKKDDSIKPVYD